MKSIIHCSTVTLLLLSVSGFSHAAPDNTTAITTSVIAPAVNQAALNATQIATVTVAQAQTLKDDSKVVIKGQIVRSLGHEKYQFRDATGTIIVDIDDEKWQGQPVSNKATVTLVGEIDHDRFPKKSVELDVDEIRF